MYFYLHENGTIINKTDTVIDADPLGPQGYFDSPFVQHWWHVADGDAKHTHPVLGMTSIWPYDNELMTFHAISLGIMGMVQLENFKTLDIIAISSCQPRTGQCRRFIKIAKAFFNEIRVYDIWNTHLREALLRYGFRGPEENDKVTITNHIPELIWIKEQKNESQNA